MKAHVHKQILDEFLRVGHAKLLNQGRYFARFARTDQGYVAPRRGYGISPSCRGGDGDGQERDSFDDRCTHILIEEVLVGALVCCFQDPAADWAGA